MGNEVACIQKQFNQRNIMTQTLGYGTIVRVKERANSIHRNHQGFVVRTDDTKNPDGPIRVWVGSECDFLMDYEHRNMIRNHYDSGFNPPKQDDANNPRISNYHPDNLEVEAEWSTETIADRFWKRLHHTYFKAPVPYEPGRVCMQRDCTAMTARRIWFNIWGSVHWADVCEVCAKKYGFNMMDDFLFKSGAFDFLKPAEKAA